MFYEMKIKSRIGMMGELTFNELTLIEHGMQEESQS